MFKIHKESFEWGGRTLTLETGKIARQADGAVLATYGETVVLATAVGAPTAKEGQDFFPLTVNYQERYYAAGKIPGGYFKRERAPTERETLISRLIHDRPIRPLFADGFKNEVLVVAQVLSHDLENDPDIVAMVAASAAALTLSGLPFQGPIGAARVGYINGEYVLNPAIDTYADSTLELVVAGTRDAVMMVESEAQQLSEDVMLGAVMFGHREMQLAINAIIRLAEKAAKDPRPVPEDMHAPVRAKLKDAASAELAKAFQLPIKFERRDALSAIKKKFAAEFVGEGEGKVPANVYSGLMHDVEADVMRNAVLDTKKRVDGRDLTTVRPIVAEVGILPRTHGSALFTRGQTPGALRLHTRHRRGRAVRGQFGRYRQADLHAALQFPAPTASVKPDAWARQVAAKSAMASSLGAPSIQCCPKRTSSPIRSAWFRKSPNPTAHPRWLQSAVLRWR